MRTVALYLMLFGLTTLAIAGIDLGMGGPPLMILALAIAGVVLVGSGLRTQKGWRPGLWTGLVVSLVLAAYFGYAFISEDATAIAAILMVMGIIGVLLIALILVQPKSRQRDF